MKLTTEEATAALHALYAHPAYRRPWMELAIKYVECTRVVPEWLEQMADRVNLWYVRHRGSNYETHAVTEADAINKVRYRIYGETAAANLPPFEAVCPCNIVIEAIGARRRTEERRTPRDLFNRKIVTKADALARLRRMNARATH